MAYFAEIQNGVVQRVISVHENDEENGAEFCHDLLGGTWVQTSFTNRIRKQYAGVGYPYDPIADVLIAPQPQPLWTLDANHDWQPPTFNETDAEQ